MIANWPPILLLFTIYALTSLLTELLSNNAVAVVVTPVAIGLAETLGGLAVPGIALVLGWRYAFFFGAGLALGLAVWAFFRGQAPLTTTTAAGHPSREE